MTPIVSYINESKRLKKNNSIIGETSKSSCISTNALINVSSNKNNLQIIHDNENNTSMNEFNIQNRESHIQIKKNCNVYEDILCTSNTKCLPKIDTSSNLLHNKTDLTNEENTHTCIINDANKEFGNIKIDNNIKNCDEDVSTNPARESRDKIFTNNTRIKHIDKSVNLDHLKSKKSQKLEQWKSQNNVEMINANYRISNNKFYDTCWQERIKP
ncbi:GATA zinc finger domain-containing protein 14 [Apis florea]|uniref:GATA zinc finger domain-containing protein 14 n=1 Tax=Apis florea TaxID=7463 RepID=UPI0006293F4B|nr:GATA zinc finger domain-containing protein 14 [Apis florea]